MKKLLLSVLLFSASYLIHAQEATPATFPGGDSAWQQYLDTSFNVILMSSQMTPKEKERFGSTQRVVYTFNIFHFLRAD